MADGSTGPLRGWYDIHTALRVEVAKLRAVVARLPTDSEALNEIDARFDFLRQVVTAHSTAEDAVLFPAMRARGIDVPHAITVDHRVELGTLYDIHRSLVELRLDREHVATSPARTLVADATHRLEEDLLAHIRVEEDELAPRLFEHFDDDEQAALFARIIGSDPPELVPRLLPWMLESISAEHRAATLEDLHKSLPPELFTGIADLIKAALPPEMWADLEQRLPDVLG
jgi:zinc finger protein-like protein